MKRVLVLFLTCLILFGAMSASAVTLTENGANIILHADSKWYIYDGDWREASQVIEKDANNNIFISVNDFRSIFQCNIMYSYDDLSIYVQHEGREIWQALFTPVMFVDKLPYPNPAPYISSISGEVMIPAEPYASVFGYTGTFSVSPDYAPGQLALSVPTKIYTIDHLEINKAMQMVIVHGKDALGTVKPIRHFLCSTGAPVSLTPNGTFYARPLSYSANNNPWYYFSLHSCWVLYCTQISGNICFHSVPFNGYGASTLSSSGYAAMGNPASHGCVRLLIEDAKFIWENCKNIPVVISDGYYDETLKVIKNELQSARPSYYDYVANLKKIY